MREREREMTVEITCNNIVPFKRVKPSHIHLPPARSSNYKHFEDDKSNHIHLPPLRSSNSIHLSYLHCGTQITHQPRKRMKNG